MSLIKMQDVPGEPWSRRAFVLLHDVSGRVQRAATYLRDEYTEKSELELCSVFLFYDLDDAPRADVGSFRRIGFFPWTEIQLEMSEALNHCLMSSYKSAYDSCRRALELAVIATYFIQENVPESDARGWLRADLGTPQFSRALKLLLQGPRFKMINDQVNWAGEITKAYWKLCDIIHVRGLEAGHQRLQPAFMGFHDVNFPQFSLDAITRVAEAFIEATKHIATLLAIENPTLLVGFDMARKFGINGPMSGFFSDVQSARLRELLIPTVRSELLRTAEGDDEVTALRKWVESFPDITSEQLEDQNRDQGEWLRRMRQNPAISDEGSSGESLAP